MNDTKTELDKQQELAVQMRDVGKKFGDVAALRNEVRDEDLQKLMLAVLGGEDDEEEDSDMKSAAD